MKKPKKTKKTTGKRSYQADRLDMPIDVTFSKKKRNDK
jgi:hypothetical protein